MPDKLKAAELLVRIRGWNEPERLNVTIDPLQSLLDSIRARMENGPDRPSEPIRPLMNGQIHLP